jgi:hypothetical protein
MFGESATAGQLSLKLAGRVYIPLRQLHFVVILLPKAATAK